MIGQVKKFLLVLFQSYFLHFFQLTKCVRSISPRGLFLLYFQVFSIEIIIMYYYFRFIIIIVVVVDQCASFANAANFNCNRSFRKTKQKIVFFFIELCDFCFLFLFSVIWMLMIRMRGLLFFVDLCCFPILFIYLFDFVVRLVTVLQG